jgi:X-Pro dipeptidyl-peptidase
MTDRRQTRTLRALALTGAGVLAAGAALSSLNGVASASPSPNSSASPASAQARPWVSGDHTVPVFSMADAIDEQVDVETGMDSDKDGKVDTIRVDISRPDTAKGQKVPLIVHASPYFFGAGDRGAWETDFFVPRGYAVATVALPGTDFATGCNDVGGKREVLGTKAIVDWANGRAKGHYLDGTPAVATKWTNGKTGMIGVSWDGTIANAVASTGVEGLETIVPVAAISSWYDYTRGNGIPFYEGHVAYLNEYVSNFDSQHCVDLTPRLQKKSDDPTGNFNKWWGVRDFRLDASKIKASVFVVAGLNDENVKTIQFGKWWELLEQNNVERRIFLHQGQHVEPFYSYGANYSTPLAQWFDYYLQGLDNGEPDEPRAIIQREDMSWSTDEEWPPTGTEDRKMTLSDPLGRSAGAITEGAAPAGSERYVTITQTAPQSQDAIVQNPTTPRGDRAVFLSDELSSQLRESGTATVTLRVKVDQPTAGFQARVVDYNGSSGFIVSRTVADLGHYESLKVDHVLTPGKYYTLTWEINTDDRIFAKNHVLGLVITAEQSNPTEPYQAVKATIDTQKSSITMPLSGDAKSLHSAGQVAPIVGKVSSPPGPAKNLEDFVHEFLFGSNG